MCKVHEGSTWCPAPGAAGAQAEPRYLKATEQAPKAAASQETEAREARKDLLSFRGAAAASHIPPSSLGHLHLLRDPSLECLPASLPLRAPPGHPMVVFISTTSRTSSYHHITPLTIVNLYITELIRCPKPSFPSSPAILLPDTTSSNCFCQASLGIYTSRRNIPKPVFYWFESLK